MTIALTCALLCGLSKPHKLSLYSYVHIVSDLNLFQLSNCLDTSHPHYVILPLYALMALACLYFASTTNYLLMTDVYQRNI